MVERVCRIDRFTGSTSLYHSPGGHKHRQFAEGSHLVSMKMLWLTADYSCDFNLIVLFLEMLCLVCSKCQVKMLISNQFHFCIYYLFILSQYPWNNERVVCVYVCELKHKMAQDLAVLHIPKITAKCIRWHWIIDLNLMCVVIKKRAKD